MARRTGAPGAKTERAWRHCGSGLRAWRRLGQFQCARRHLELFSVRLAPFRDLIERIDSEHRYFCALGASQHNLFIKSFKLYSNFFWEHEALGARAAPMLVPPIPIHSLHSTVNVSTVPEHK